MSNTGGRILKTWSLHKKENVPCVRNTNGAVYVDAVGAAPERRRQPKRGRLWGERGGNSKNIWWKVK